MDPGGDLRRERNIVSPEGAEATDIEPCLDVARQTEDLVFDRDLFVETEVCHRSKEREIDSLNEGVLLLSNLRRSPSNFEAGSGGLVAHRLVASLR
jgi:hypothetical protein